MTPPLVEGALTAPAVARNRDPILAILRRVLPAPESCWRSRAAPASMRCTSPRRSRI